MHATLAGIVLAAWAAAAEPGPQGYFEIQVVDEQTGRGVPLVELTTVDNVSHHTDSQGYVAFFEPGLMGQHVYFHVRSHGYEFPKNGFGFRGQGFDVSPGGKGQIALKRVNVAERLYRMTGAGIYRDSILLGKPAPIERPLLNGQVFGSDSVVTAVHRGKLYWFWGDTNRPSGPLGLFHVPGATSDLPADPPAGGRLDPDRGVDLRYFVDDGGFVKATCRMPGEGPTWIDALVNVRDEQGEERLFAHYVKVRGWLTVYAQGLCRFDDERNEFEPFAEFDMQAPLYPEGHPFEHEVDGQRYFYYCQPFPLVRVRADVAALADLRQYEAWTCLPAGSRFDRERVGATAIERDAAGQVVWGWKKYASPLGVADERRLVEAGLLSPAESRLAPLDVATGQPVNLVRGSVYFNAWRKRFVIVAVEGHGTSELGEVWYAEADSPTGPWAYARKIVTHERYSFYNPKQHPQFDEEGGRRIYFEGTYSQTFSGNQRRTPRYDYNQIMYRLDLADERLALPAIVRQSNRGEGAATLAAGAGAAGEVAFMALDRAAPGAIEIDGATLPALYGLAVDSPETPQTAPLYVYRDRQGRIRRYSLDENLQLADCQRDALPPCRVWRLPVGAVAPQAANPDE